ncbi:hypothetical protein E2562_004857 [Oryza meyeriana var. granulata]|uniref:Uncharacterized protein n=1 Tax=Oryza meyeriana var. granulata TaxID=110450 RepID=A0A6G1DEN5_9ORYZ|nr:hypothetical protein E2562_004857 [Oryza meyeriana var. granulata]
MEFRIVSGAGPRQGVRSVCGEERRCVVSGTGQQRCDEVDEGGLRPVTTDSRSSAPPIEAQDERGKNGV